MKRFAHSLVLIGVAATAPVWALSVPAESTAKVLPDNGAPAPGTYVAGNLTAGSASVVPFMAADMEANHLSTIDATASSASSSAKPIDDITFVRRATENGRKEVSAAREALPQLKQPELKRIAEMLVSDHTGANERLSKIAEAKGWPVPAPQPAAPPPSGTASSDFDATWTADMIAGHERSIALFRAQAMSGEDKDLRKYAQDTLPTIEHHLAELRKLQK